MKLVPDLSCIKSNQKGQALILVLILLLLAGLIMGPLLAFMSTGLKAGRLHEKKMHEFYAADAGIEDALWHLQTDERVKELILELDTGYSPTDGWDDWTPADYDNWPLAYDLMAPSVNMMDVEVTIDPSWILKDLLSLPDSEPAKGSDDNANDHWTVIGAINTDGGPPLTNYIVDITTDEPADTLVDHIGVWLPRGYGYDGSVTINGVHIGQDDDEYPDSMEDRMEEILGLVSNPSSISHRGGTALIWDYSSGDVSFEDLSDITPPPKEGQPPAEKFPPSVRLSFDYTGKEGKGFFPWIKLADDHIAWDTEAGLYHIESLACEPGADKGTTVEAYTPRGVMRYTSGSGGTSSAIKGDHIVIGNSLMTCCWGGNCEQTECCGTNPSRNYAPVPDIFSDVPDAERESSAQVLSPGEDDPGYIPSDAKIERAYLYWTAWLRGDKVWNEAEEHEDEPWIWDACMDTNSDPNNWEEALEDELVPEEVDTWLGENAYDGEAYLAVNGEAVMPTNEGDPDGTVVAGTVYISEGSSDVQPSYQYACFADVTDQVISELEEQYGDDQAPVNGVTYTVGGVHAHSAEGCGSGNTWNNSSNAGWSMIIIYSSAEKETHQIYLYEGCNHLWDMSAEFTIAGFETPLDLEEDETNEAKLTVFASEGDEFGDEYLRFRGEDTGYYDLYDLPGNNRVFNSISSASGFDPSDIPGQPEGEISGVDIDTYISTYPGGGTPLSEIVEEGDTSAQIKVRSSGDGFMLIYVVFSVRSTKVPAGGAEFQVGTMSYKIK